MARGGVCFNKERATRCRRSRQHVLHTEKKDCCAAKGHMVVLLEGAYVCSCSRRLAS